MQDWREPRAVERKRKTGYSRMPTSRQWTATTFFGLAWTVLGLAEGVRLEGVLLFVNRARQLDDGDSRTSTNTGFSSQTSSTVSAAEPVALIVFAICYCVPTAGKWRSGAGSGLMGCRDLPTHHHVSR
jgi:hypothetical protein